MAIGWGLAAQGAMNYMSSRSQSRAMGQANQPLPTYYQYAAPSPMQAQIGQGAMGAFNQMYGGGMGGGQGGGMGVGPAGGMGGAGGVWGGGMPMPMEAQIGGADVPNLQALQAQYSGQGSAFQQALTNIGDITGQQVAAAGGGLGTPRTGMAGAGQDIVAGALARNYAPMYQAMVNQPAQAQFGGQLQAGMQQAGMQGQAGLMGQEQAWGAQMLPYQQMPMQQQMGMPEMLVGHDPRMQQIQPGAPMPPDYQQQIANLQQQQRTQPPLGESPMGWNTYQY